MWRMRFPSASIESVKLSKYIFEPCGLTQMIGLKYGTVPIDRGEALHERDRARINVKKHVMFFSSGRSTGTPPLPCE